MPEHEMLKALYPFLHGAHQDADRLDAALLESVRRKAQDSVDAKTQFFEESAPEVVRIAHAIADVYRTDGRLFAMGNGGSSCDAAHIAVEFLHPVTTGRPALTAINLVADMAMLTAVGNDVGFNHIFVRQLVAQARRGDALIGVSTSGNSENLLAAFAKAKEMGLLTVGLSGHDGGRMSTSGALDHCLVVRSDSIHRVQETHVAIYHILWDLVHTLLADDRGGLGASATAPAEDAP
ncbi:MAG: SIS domain-containing protein [Paraburkholderia sp.]|uniref:D-sedoheptulose-7-phosphate isomerase n=1 Tax=Paraburkholderia sp. TaxID=1926495 RepID=UPI003C5D1B30